MDMNKAILADFRRFMVYAGPHPWEDAGWQIAFDFGKVQVSVACTPDTQGVELMAWGLFVKPLKHVTPVILVNVLKRLMNDALDASTASGLPLSAQRGGE
jgi:hypothetical protein